MKVVADDRPSSLDSIQRSQSREWWMLHQGLYKSNVFVRCVDDEMTSSLWARHKSKPCCVQQLRQRKKTILLHAGGCLNDELMDLDLANSNRWSSCKVRRSGSINLASIG